MDQVLYLTIAGAAGGAIGQAIVPTVQRMPTKIYRSWVQECADVLGQADQLDNVVDLNADQAQRAKIIGAELEAAIAMPHSQKASGARALILSGTLALIFVAIASTMPLGMKPIAWMGFATWIVMMAAVDWETTLLPDDMTIPLIWAGLIASCAGWISVPLNEAVAGAVAGYGSLRLMYEGHKAITGQEGMGHGDFKLLSAIGAWLGWTAIIPVLIMASLTGLVAYGIVKLAKTRREGGIIPFGPFLGAGALLVALCGVEWPLRQS